MTYIEKIQRLLSIYGFRRTVSKAFVIAADKLLPSKTLKSKGLPDSDAAFEFDRRWGLDTNGIFNPSKDEVGANWQYGLGYRGVDPAVLEQCLGGLDGLERFTFIDFGSGKGRAVLVASRFPFRKTIGVEYSHELHVIAEENLARFPESERRCGDVEFVCADATTYELPAGPLLIFLHNPFGKKLMGIFARHVMASFRKDPREMLILYFHGNSPSSPEVWRDAGFVEAPEESSRWVRFTSPA